MKNKLFEFISAIGGIIIALIYIIVIVEPVVNWISSLEDISYSDKVPFILLVVMMTGIVPYFSRLAILTFLRKFLGGSAECSDDD